MMKTYRSSSAIAVNVTLKDPRQRVHLQFMPLTEGGSIYATSNRRLQRALEQHPRFGSLFRLDAVVGSEPGDTPEKK